MEDDFLEALVASERIAEWVASIKRSSSLDGERKQAAVHLALAQMLQQVSQSQVYAEEAVLANVDKELAQLVDDNDKESAQLFHELFSFVGRERGKVEDGEKREYVLKDGTSIALYEQALTHGVGAKVWHAAEILCLELSQHPWNKLLSGKDVLELGAGCGLCGFYAGKIGANRVCLTDFEDSLLQNLVKSSHLSGEGFRVEPYAYKPTRGSETNREQQQRVLEVAKLDWLDQQRGENEVEMEVGDFPVLDPSDTYEIVIGSDLMYEMEPSVALAGVIQRHLSAEGTCLLAMKMRYEDILKSFLGKAEECNLIVFIKKAAEDSGGLAKQQDDDEDKSKLFGGGHHIILLIHHREWGLSNAQSLPRGFCSAKEFGS